jgi:hypothetical protein
MRKKRREPWCMKERRERFRKAFSKKKKAVQKISLSNLGTLFVYQKKKAVWVFDVCMILICPLFQSWVGSCCQILIVFGLINSKRNISNMVILFLLRMFLPLLGSGKVFKKSSLSSLLGLVLQSPETLLLLYGRQIGSLLFLLSGLYQSFHSTGILELF